MTGEPAEATPSMAAAIPPTTGRREKGKLCVTILLYVRINKVYLKHSSENNTKVPDTIPAQPRPEIARRRTSTFEVGDEPASKDPISKIAMEEKHSSLKIGVIASQKEIETSKKLGDWNLYQPSIKLLTGGYCSD